MRSSSPDWIWITTPRSPGGTVLQACAGCTCTTTPRDTGVGSQNRGSRKQQQSVGCSGKGNGDPRRVMELGLQTVPVGLGRGDMYKGTRSWFEVSLEVQEGLRFFECMYHTGSTH